MMRSPDQFLVTTEWLEANLGAQNLRILDCTGIANARTGNTGYEEHYLRHHIPGAAYLDMANPKGPLSDPDGLLPWKWPRQEAFEHAMGALGIGNEDRVIVYSAANPLVPGSGISWATRSWWLMHHFGVNCALLDGGFVKWQREGRPVEADASTYPPCRFSAEAGWERGRAGKDDVLGLLDDPYGLVVDSLSPESYRGEGSKAYGTFGRRKGHITGAVNVDYESLTDPDTGCFLEPSELYERFARAGLRQGSKVITYCGGGIGATATGLALKLAGHDDVAIYDGSLMEWANDPSLPMTDPSGSGA